MKRSRGFTLIELIVVIGIIGLLTAIVIANLGTARAKGRDSKRASDIKQLQLALENYFTNNQTYPVCNDTSCLPGALAPTYLPSMPTDPTNSGNYVYGYIGNASTYCLGITLEVLNPNTLGTSASCSTNISGNSFKVSNQ
ncbi:MAG TPA: prepilin-type N-terminal cleavage/methylation domain-containing protein [Candidatus Paceibacterota bacterium]|nr:prepilin-type N-terminal cleavage/methylation domain-containing protein [Candidatus Paceibacterota bacterium]